MLIWQAIQDESFENDRGGGTRGRDEIEDWSAAITQPASPTLMKVIKFFCI